MRNANSVPCCEAADVHLIRSGVLQVVVAVAAHEVPLFAEIVVDACHREIRSLREGDVGAKSQNVNAVATRETTSAGLVRQRHVLVPKLLDHRIDAEPAWIA